MDFISTGRPAGIVYGFYFRGAGRRGIVYGLYFRGRDRVWFLFSRGRPAGIVYGLLFRFEIKIHTR